MDNAELFAYCEAYDSDEDIENTELDHIAGSDGIRLANMVISRNYATEKILFEEYELREKNPGLWSTLHLTHDLETEAIFEQEAHLVRNAH